MFDSEPLAAPVALFGEPVVRLRVRHPGPRTLVSVKLQNVAPDGSSQPVTSAAVNIEVAGETALDLPLMAAGWRFPAGHRIRVAVAVADWPNLWPLPEVAPLEIISPVELELPGLPDDAVAFTGRTSPWSRSSSRARDAGRVAVDVVTDVLTGRAGIVTSMRNHDAMPAEGWSITESGGRWAMAGDDDPLSAAVKGHWRYRLKRPGPRGPRACGVAVRATADAFLVDLRLRVSADGEPFAERRWKERIPRRGV